NGVAAPMHRPFAVPAGGRLRFGARRAGTRATLAVQGGFDLPLTFASRATSLVSRMGPFGGRPLARGDRLEIGEHRSPFGPLTRAAGPPALGEVSGVRAPGDAQQVGDPVPDSEGARLRVLLGPHDAMFTAAAVEALFTTRFTITPQSNRMGYRLDGARLDHAGVADILSDATPMGSLQVPASGHPILLMADRQTTGGYPKIATVISADLPLAGQLAPGDWIEFVPCTHSAALDALRDREAALARFTT
ncbi:MAG: biotin-dependent carboxyltransferase family protein, partial [Acidobacteriota bacterium]